MTQIPIPPPPLLSGAGPSHPRGERRRLALDWEKKGDGGGDLGDGQTGCFCVGGLAWGVGAVVGVGR